MEGEPVVDALAHQRLDVGDVVGRQVGAHFDDQAAERGVQIEEVVEILSADGGGHLGVCRSFLGRAAVGGFDQHQHVVDGGLHLLGGFGLEAGVVVGHPVELPGFDHLGTLGRGDLDRALVDRHLGGVGGLVNVEAGAADADLGVARADGDVEFDLGGGEAEDPLGQFDGARGQALDGVVYQLVEDDLRAFADGHAGLVDQLEAGGAVAPRFDRLVEDQGLAVHQALVQGVSVDVVDHQHGAADLGGGEGGPGEAGQQREAGGEFGGSRRRHAVENTIHHGPRSLIASRRTVDEQ